MERLITKSFKRLLDKGTHRGFITYEELGKSLGKRHFSQQNVESAFLHIFDNKISLVGKKSDYSASKKRESLSHRKKPLFHITIVFCHRGFEGFCVFSNLITEFFCYS